MEIDLATKQQLSSLLAKPEMVTHAHAAMLAELVKTYPYYSPLHLLLAKADVGTDHKERLATAALYTSGTLLHKVIHAPETLTPTKVNLVGFNGNENSNSAPAVEGTLAEQAPFEQMTTPNAEADEQEVFEEIAEFEPVIPTIKDAPEEEVFEEIAEIDQSIYAQAKTEEEGAHSLEQEKTGATLPDEMAIENIVATDFFAFEKSFTTEQAIEKPTASVLQPEEYDQEAEAQMVSKYNDDKLPYTFLWWLAKTRKEHEQIFQPYVTPKEPITAPQSELQQQYVEHIFHLQTPFTLADEANKDSVNKGITHKGDEIIETFIKNEPQIRAPKADQLNNENKAKKSAEDHNDLVSETLAAIYIEQMLYHKAIETYEKLSLKFPEKSRYFADLIQSLEKKI